MATPNISDEEIQFRKRARRRLVGAIVLVLVVVVVVPWILPAEKPQQDTQQIDIRIPAQDASGYAPKILPAPPAAPISAPAPAAQPSQPAPAIAPVEPSAAKAATPEPLVKAVAEPAKVAVAKPEAKPEAKPHAQAEPKAKVEPKPEPKSAAAAGEGIYVQYGAFSESKNAKQRQAELKAKGIATYTEVVKTSSGDKIRVRSGPYATREAAEKARQKAKPLDSKLVIVGGKG